MRCPRCGSDAPPRVLRVHRGVTFVLVVLALAASYAILGDVNASHCLGCPAPCAGACPHGVPIQPKMLEAHGRLSIG